MAKQRTPAKPSPSSGGSSPIWTALILVGAVGYGLAAGVEGEDDLASVPVVASAYTLFGCVALVGPLVLARQIGRGISGRPRLA